MKLSFENLVVAKFSFFFVVGEKSSLIVKFLTYIWVDNGPNVHPMKMPHLSVKSWKQPIKAYKPMMDLDMTEITSSRDVETIDDIEGQKSYCIERRANT